MEPHVTGWDHFKLLMEPPTERWYHLDLTLDVISELNFKSHIFNIQTT